VVGTSRPELSRPGSGVCGVGWGGGAPRAGGLVCGLPVTNPPHTYEVDLLLHLCPPPVVVVTYLLASGEAPCVPCSGGVSLGLISTPTCVLNNLPVFCSPYLSGGVDCAIWWSLVSTSVSGGVGCAIWWSECVPAAVFYRCEACLFLVESVLLWGSWLRSLVELTALWWS
jgi:hypothetical protein